jgi:hypothetical protein
MAKSDVGFDPALYAPVAERLRLFWAAFPNGRITTRLVSRTEHDVVFEARVYRASDDTEPAATGWAAEREGDGDVNTVACLENTETSAVGRALANLGFTAARERPSVEEMRKAARVRARREGRSPAEDARRVGHPFAPRLAHDLELRQRRADAVSDVLLLVRAAAQCGLRPRRAEAMRRRLVAETTPASAVDGIARVLRRWIAKRVQREVRDLGRAPHEQP